MKIQKGNDLLLFNGQWVIAAGTVFKMNSCDPNYFAVPLTSGVYVDLRGIVEVWCGGVQVPKQLQLFAEDAK